MKYSRQAVCCVLCVCKQRVLLYAALQFELYLLDLHAPQNLIVLSMYGGLLEGRVSQKDGMLEISTAMGNDIGPHEVDSKIYQQLGAWSLRQQAPLRLSSVTLVLLVWLTCMSLLPRLCVLV